MWWLAPGPLISYNACVCAGSIMKGRRLRVRWPGALAALLLLWGGHVMAVDGVLSVESHFDPTQTLERLEAEVKAKGLTVFARVDHAAGAATVGLPLRPTTVLVFGNPKRRNAAHAGEPTGGARAAVEGARLAGRCRQDLALLRGPREPRE